jgi:biopolymer transport protein ExbD
LIIFFSVSSTFIKESRFDIELPETGEVAEMSGSETSVGVYVDRYGKLSVGAGIGDKEPITFSLLREKLSRMMIDQPETSVSIFGDKRVDYQSIISVMDICRESGIKSISIVAIED